jgi:hypothetical protein
VSSSTAEIAVGGRGRVPLAWRFPIGAAPEAAVCLSIPEALRGIADRPAALEGTPDVRSAPGTRTDFRGKVPVR